VPAFIRHRDQQRSTSAAEPSTVAAPASSESASDVIALELSVAAAQPPNPWPALDGEIRGERRELRALRRLVTDRASRDEAPSPARSPRSAAARTRASGNSER
jgi:hypothetical protein